MVADVGRAIADLPIKEGDSGEDALFPDGPGIGEEPDVSDAVVFGLEVAKGVAENGYEGNVTARASGIFAGVAIEGEQLSGAIDGVELPVIALIGAQREQAGAGKQDDADRTPGPTQLDTPPSEMTNP